MVKLTTHTLGHIVTTTTWHTNFLFNYCPHSLFSFPNLHLCRKLNLPSARCPWRWQRGGSGIKARNSWSSSVGSQLLMTLRRKKRASLLRRQQGECAPCQPYNMVFGNRCWCVVRFLLFISCAFHDFYDLNDTLHQS